MFALYYAGEFSMKKIDHIIQNPDQLNKLKTWPFPFFRPEINLKIESDIISEEQKKKWEKRLKERMEDCGCELAGMGFTFGAFGYVIWIFAGPIKLVDLNLNHIWQGIIAAIALLTVGKLFGLRRARKRLDKAIREIWDMWRIHLTKA
jgi:hypothetical protein